ncbi:MAG: hypothetical protein EXS36_15555 [Pedosphaera sp.]|nr:hypothetical protein [Pedosphaera sp.]
MPDFVAFYPWMSVREALDYQASFRRRWNLDLDSALIAQFQLDPDAPTSGLSKGQRTQLALIGAITAEPEMLVLDEQTSSLDPLVRREFIQTVIGAYQDAAPAKRTVFVSTHLITEFDGLIDRFTVLDHGKAVLTSDADEARSKFRRLRARFEGDAPAANEFEAAKSVKRDGRSLELIVNGNGDKLLTKLRAMKPAEVTTESLRAHPEVVGDF